MRHKNRRGLKLSKNSKSMGVLKTLNTMEGEEFDQVMSRNDRKIGRRVIRPPFQLR
jgi:hypothetical protein